MKRFAPALFMLFLACGKTPGGAQTAGFGESIPLVGTNLNKISVGVVYDSVTNRKCTFIGTNVDGAQGLKYGLSSLHCWKSPFNCTNKTFTWSDNTVATCVNVTAVAGQGSGDYVYLQFSGGMPASRDVKLAPSIEKEDKLFVLGPNGKFREQKCAVQLVNLGNRTFEHNCLQGDSSGWSGAPIFKSVGDAKELVGFHTGQGDGSKHATAWPIKFGDPSVGSLPGVAQNHIYEKCRNGFLKFIMDKLEVKPQLDENKLNQNALEAVRKYDNTLHPAGVPKTALEAFLATDIVDFTYDEDCRKLAGTNPVGRRLLVKGDSCMEGLTTELCWRDCCDGESGRVSGNSSKIPGCEVYLEIKGNPEATCLALPGKPPQQ